MFVQQGLISELTWLEEIAGFEQPEEEQDRMWVEAQLKSTAGQAYTLELAAKKKGNQELLKLAGLQSSGQASPGGTPTSALPPRPGDPSATGEDPAPTGPNTGNPAASAVAGIMSGASQTGPQANVIQQTGQPAETTT